MTSPLRCLLLAWLAFAPAASGLTLTVGPDAGCQHATLQGAIDALPAGAHTIELMARTWTAQAVKLQDRRQLSIIGGFVSCTPGGGKAGVSVLDGSGGNDDSVLQITGHSEVFLHDLRITGGDEVDDGYGGGIDFRGRGLLSLTDVHVTRNAAGYGGGISVTGGDGYVSLSLREGTLIDYNVAQRSGGGVRMDGLSRLHAVADVLRIAHNQALGVDGSGYGGGIEIIGPAAGFLASTGDGTRGAMHDNVARYGGAIAVIAGDESPAHARLDIFGRDALRPTRLHGNRAQQTGGAIYVRANIDVSSDVEAVACVQDFHLDDNTAQEGSAIYADSTFGAVNDGGGRVFLGACDEPAIPGRIACRGSDDCNTVASNRAETPAGVATQGATLTLQTDAWLHVDGSTVRDNRGGRVVLSHGSTRMTNVAIVDNAVSLDLLAISEEASDVELRHATIAGNEIGAAHVISSGSGLEMYRSILWQPGKTSLRLFDGEGYFEYLLVSERASLDEDSPSVVANVNPRFVDAAAGNYRLAAASRAVDFAPTIVAHDRDGAPRPRDIPELPNEFGSADLGAYERAALQPILLNGGFDTGLSFWSDSTPGASTHDPASDVSNSPDSGSLRVQFTDPPVPLTVRSQCVFLPVAGRYALNAAGRSPGNIGLRDVLSLRWELYNTGPLPCFGRPLRGDSHGVSASPAWFVPSPPALIEIGEAEFGPNTSLMVRLVVTDAGGSVPNVANGWFDFVHLQPTTLVLEWPGFRDGFE